MKTETTLSRAAIIHGYGATPEDHWFGWLAERLEADGVPTVIPALPDPDHPDPGRWAEALRAGVGTPDEHSAIVAHSLGCLTVLRHLCALPDPWRLGTLVLVSGFLDRLPALPELDAYIGDGCEVDGLADRVGRLVVMRSDADPLVPSGHTDRLAERLGVPVTVVPGAGHFLASDGFTTLPEALEALTP
ncbi:RBBP9/YdeN family alpha/beta hydrolase [Streptomyces palmae]|uniref:Serine hydrolase family protein n=1 Tax=Streptomyces palmae TaxID=1701085 RepID=A0A4Z0HI42_9ACTN|nr:alpha/beta hydrolase [Streptomyces palmae]TGB16816.1 serine hydrolase family protein [Streptomyces palmae]